MNMRWLVVRQLDEQLNEWHAVKDKYGIPKKGWIKTIRTALRISMNQLALRLNLSEGRILQLESAEEHGAVTLNSLKQAAEAMGCEFVYAIVPKGTTTLETIIKSRAMELANENIDAIAHSMALENQAVSEKNLAMQKSELFKILSENFSKKIWYKDLTKASAPKIAEKKKLFLINKNKTKK
jgi:predicted DNA-binding mobile mystery protein A